MAGSATDEDEDLFEPTTEVESEDQEVEAAVGEGEEPETDEEETEVGFGDDDPGEQDGSEPFRQVRQRLREVEAENRELRKTQPPPKAIEVGPRPTLESCEWDEDRFTDEVIKWNGQKETAERQSRTPTQEAQAAIDDAVTRFQAKRSQIRSADFDQVVAGVKQALGEDAMAAVVLVAENAPALIYALGTKSPARLEQLAKTPPHKLAYAVGALEKDLKVTTKKRAPEPDQPVRGSASLSAGKDKHLARLEAEADRTNDRSKVIAYKRELKRKAG